VAGTVLDVGKVKEEKLVCAETKPSGYAKKELETTGSASQTAESSNIRVMCHQLKR